MVTTLTAEQEVLLIHAAAKRRAPLEETLTAALEAAVTAEAQVTINRTWTDKELAMVRDARNTPAAIARATGRTPAAVSQRRAKLAKQEGLTNLQRRPRTKPAHEPPTVTQLPPDASYMFCDQCDDRATHFVQYPGTRTPDARLCPVHTPEP